jgi:hypothetical protein
VSAFFVFALEREPTPPRNDKRVHFLLFSIARRAVAMERGKQPSQVETYRRRRGHVE